MAGTRDRIVDAAAHELAASGVPERLSLRGIARAAGISAMAIYHHFESLDDIVVEVKVRFYGELHRALVGDREESRVPLRRLGVRYIEFALANPGKYTVLFSTPVQFDRLLGRASLELLEKEMADAGSEEPRLDALNFWNALHGAAHLRIMQAVIDWPAIDVQVDRLCRSYDAPGPS